ncbi:MAG: ABC transporter ATP-binding protein [Planctomycetes bacterium]|nr:ABC transporter ATP-binding protein [Planctomycetota bacterium]
MPLAICCRQLVKSYEGKPPVEAVRGLNLEVPTGECFGLLGPNGAGKTTTMEILEGLLDATSAEQLEILGLRWGHDDDAIRNRIGISLQETRLSDRLTVLETVTLFRSFYQTGIPPEEAIRRVSLEEKSDARIEKLSGGQKQRLAIALAIVGDPELLFLDEPTTGLDPHSRRELWEIIRGFKATGRTVLVTTHYMDEAERLCDRVAVVDHGQVIALGSPVELISRLGGQHIVDFSLSENSRALTVDELQRLPSVQTVRQDNSNFSLSVEEPHVALPGLMNYLQGSGREFATLTTRHATLEDVFVTLTGRHLQEQEPAA